jgi:hypothetical protein
VRAIFILVFSSKQRTNKNEPFAKRDHYTDRADKSLAAAMWDGDTGFPVVAIRVAALSVSPTALGRA